MRHFILFLIVTAATAADVSVAVPDTLPAAAQAAVDRYTADVAKIREDAEKAVAKKSAELAKVLIKTQDEVTKKGDLQGALAIKAKIAALPVMPGVDALGNKTNVKPEIQVISASKFKSEGLGEKVQLIRNSVKAEASSTAGAYSAEQAFPGSHSGTAWAFAENVGSGRYSLTFKEPIIVRTIVIFGRMTHEGSDAWGEGKININGQEYPFEEFSGGKVAVVTFPSVIRLATLSLEAKNGTQAPGLAGFEMYR